MPLFLRNLPCDWLPTLFVCVVPILMREVSVIDKRYSNTNTSLPPPLSACQCTRINLQAQPTISLQSHFFPNWSPKSSRMFFRIVGAGAVVDHQSLSSHSDLVFILIIRQEFSISKRSLAAYLSDFFRFFVSIWCRDPRPLCQRRWQIDEL